MRMGGWSVLLVAALAGTGHAGFGDNAVGVNTHIPATDVVDLVTGLDAHWIRVDNNWRDQTDPCSGSIGFFAPLDAAVSYALGEGLGVYMTLAYVPACASIGDGDGNALNDVPDATLYGNYVRQSVAHYRSMGVRHFGLWNEPNLDGFFEGTAAQYVSNVLTPGFPAVVQGCNDAGFSDCVVMGPDLAHVGDYDVYLEAVLDGMTGAGLRFDIFTHHIYQSVFTQIYEGDSFLNALEERRFSFTRRSLMDVLEETGYATDGVPVFEVWITEAGMRAQPPTDAGEMADQEAEYMGILDYQLERAWYTNTIFYEILDSMDEIDGFGITRRNGDGSFLLKDAYHALRDRIAAEPQLNGTAPADPDAGPVDAADAGSSGDPDGGATGGAADASSSGGGDGGPGASGDEGDGGCGCRTTGARDRGGALLAFGLLLALRPSRRRSSGCRCRW